MLLRSASEDRPYHLGPFPLEVLARDAGVTDVEAERPRIAGSPPRPVADTAFARAVARYDTLFRGFIDGEVAAARAPVPDDPQRRAADIKGGAYFLNASQVGICRLPANAWLLGAEPVAHDHAVVILVEHGRLPEPGNPARDWIGDAAAETFDMRAGSLAVVVAGHIRRMGFAARAHTAADGLVDLNRLAVLAGLAFRDPDGRIRNPFIDGGFALAAVLLGETVGWSLLAAAGAVVLCVAGARRFAPGVPK